MRITGTGIEVYLDMKRFILPLCIILLLLCSSACDGSDATDIQDDLTSLLPLETVEEMQSEIDPYKSLIQQFFYDADMPEVVREQFHSAVRGDKEAQEWIYEYAGQHDDLTWPVAETVYRYNSTSTENVCLFNIAMLYYYGRDDIGIMQDRRKAFEWVKLSANKGNADAALCAGDMVRYGNGVPVDEVAAYEFYSIAHSIEPDGFTGERLGDCYLDGIGITADRQKAFDYYLECAFMGYSAGMYKLSHFAEYADMNLTALYKAASSINYSGGYWAMAYDGLDGYAADDLKRDLVGKLLDIWDSGSDPAASNLRKAMCSNKHFSSEFAEVLTQTVYTYSYHAFAEEYGLWPNRTYEDVSNIHFAPYDTSDPEYGYLESMAERYLEYDGCKFYEYDFDGDGVDEIGIPLHSGAGGAFMGDGFGIFKKNKDGLYESYASGPDCSLRDAMRIIQYDGKIYFVVNPFDDTQNAPHNVIARTIDKYGKGHEITIVCKDYTLQHVITYTREAYSVGYYALFSEVEQQMQNAVISTKQQRVYSPDGEKQLAYDGDDDWWSNIGGGYWGEVTRQDVFFTADINNDGVAMVIHKGRLITQTKYYDDFNWFQIYDGNDFAIGSTPIKVPEFYGDYYGLHSDGNLYELLPVENNVVQFWTHEHSGVTYCVTLQRYGLLYTLQIFEVRNGEVSLVSKSLFFDEAQEVDILFS